MGSTVQEILEQQVAEQARFDAEFQKTQDAAFRRAEEARAAVIERSKTPPVGPELGKIIAILQASPFLIAPTLRFVVKLQADVQAAMQKILDTSVGAEV